MIVVIVQRTSKYFLQTANRILNRSLKVDRHKYFAFGANMDVDSLKKKSIFPATSVAAMVDDHQIEISLPCEWYGKGFASIVNRPDHQVFGVLHEVTPLELAILDVLEWVPFNFHRRIEISVNPVDGGDPCKAWAYIAKYPRSGLKTSIGYRNLLVKGARDLKLPDTYVDELANLPVAESFEPDFGFRLSNPSKRRWLETKLTPFYKVHDQWREKLCRLLP
jgi:hypothetical protein